MKYDAIKKEIENRINYLETKREEYKHKSIIEEGQKALDYKKKYEESDKELDKLYRINK